MQKRRGPGLWCRSHEVLRGGARRVAARLLTEPPAWCAADVSLVEQALDALAQRGSWVCRDPLADLEQTRAELRRAARHRGIRLRTTINWAGYLIAHTPDGFPAEEPWRGAAIHIHDSDAWVDVIQLAWRRQAEEGSD